MASLGSVPLNNNRVKKVGGILFLSVAIAFALRFGSLVGDNVYAAITVDKELATTSATTDAARTNETEDKYNIIMSYPDDVVHDEVLAQKIKARRIASRPYGHYCSVEVINEQQLWPFARKKVIAFSLFRLDSSKKNRPFASYSNGVKANIKNAAFYYPDWIIRIFTFGLSSEQIDDLIQVNPSRVEVVICSNSTNNNTLAKGYSVRAATRFLAYDDPSIYAVISRDSDSRFSPRELLAVNEWLASDDHCFHTMKDHVKHLGIVALAGMFGIKKGCLDSPQRLGNNHASRTTMTSLFDRAVEDDPEMSSRSYDQWFLSKYVVPKLMNRTMSHDFHIHACKNSGTDCRSFPLGPANVKSPKDKKDYYVGQTFRSEATTASPGYSCTLECHQAPEEEA